MKNTTIKNVLFILSGMMIAASASIFAAQNTTTLEANLVNLRQYLKELYITSTGTPAGDVVMYIDESGEFQQIRGNASLINSSDNYFGVSGFVGSIQEGTGGYTYINGIVGTEDPANFLAVVLNGNPKDYIAVQSGGVIMTTTPSGSDTGYDLDLTPEGIFARGIDQGTSNNMTRQDGTKLSYIMRLLNDGTLMLKNYIFPLADGLAGQVLATDGLGQLYWTDVGDGGGFSLGVTSINGATGAVFLTTDDIEEGNNNQFIYTKRFQLSSAQVLDLHNTPIQVIDAPGAGKMVTIVDVFGRIQPGAMPYTLNSFPNVSLYYQDQPIENGYKTNFDFLAETSEFVQKMSPGCFGNCASDMNNKPLFIGMEPGGSVTDGDGSVDVYVSYKILDLEMTAE